MPRRDLARRGISQVWSSPQLLLDRHAGTVPKAMITRSGKESSSNSQGNLPSSPPPVETPASEGIQSDSCGPQLTPEAPSCEHARGARAHASAPALNPFRVTHRNSEEVDSGRARRTEGTKGASAPVANGNADDCPTPINVQKIDKRTGEISVVGLPCERKSCPHCGPKLRKKYVGHYVNVFSELPSLRFVTLTVDPKTGLSPEDSTKFVKDRWERRFIKRIKRKTEGELKYVASVEKQKNGYAHLHAVISTTVGESVLRQQWFESGGGVVMEAEKIPKGRSLARRVGYTMKYAFEDIDQVEGNAVLASEGIGYHSKAAKEERRQYAESDEQDDSGGESRFEFNGPTTGGRRPSSGGITEEDRERFDQIYEQARSRQYIRWDDEENRSLPRGGTRIIYDDATGQTTKERVRKVRDGSGGTKVVTPGPDP